MNSRSHRRKNVIVNIPAEKTWPPKPSDWIVIILAFVTLIVAAITLWVAHYEGSTSELQQEQINKMQYQLEKLDSQMIRLSRIDSSTQYQLAEQREISSKISRELGFVARTFARNSYDSAQRYETDSLTVMAIAQKAFDITISQSTRGINDSLTLVLNLLQNVYMSSNLYLNAHIIEKKAWRSMYSVLAALHTDLIYERLERMGGVMIFSTFTHLWAVAQLNGDPKKRTIALLEQTKKNDMYREKLLKLR